MKKISLLLLFLSNFCLAQYKELGKKLDEASKGKRATVGFSIMSLDGKEQINSNNHIHFPMQSVYKFHLALAILKEVDKGKLALNQKIFVKKSDLLPETHSPLRDKYPHGNIELPLSEILSFTVSKSDNNGCDILFRLLGKPTDAEKFIKSVGIEDISIKTTEEEMHQDNQAQFTNWTTPLAATQLLQKFYQQKILSKSSTDFLWKILVETSTGTNRIKGQLPKEAIVGHKTGWSGANKEGLTVATNDIGIVKCPNGKVFAVAVFVENSMENDDTNAKIISDISKIAYDYFSKK